MKLRAKDKADQKFTENPPLQKEEIKKSPYFLKSQP